MAISKITTSSMNKPFGFKNLIINGAMSVAQRATSATTLTHASYKTIDRMSQNLTANSFVLTSEQSTDAPVGFDYSLKIACTTADTSLAATDRMMFLTRVEDKDLGHLEYGTAGAKSLTLSFYVKSNKTGTYQVNLWHNNASKFTSATYTIDSASTWERKTMTFHGDSSTLMGNDGGAALQVEMILLAGTNYTSGTINTSSTYASTANTRAASQTVNIADSTSNTWQVTGMQLEVGTKASDFEHIPFDINLQRCQRYCFSEPAGDAYHLICNGFYPNTSLFIGIINLPTTMRGEPSITTSGSFQTASTTDKTASNFTSTDNAVSNINAVQIRADVSSVTAGHGANLRNANDATAKFILSSEL